MNAFNQDERLYRKTCLLSIGDKYIYNLCNNERVMHTNRCGV